MIYARRLRKMLGGGMRQAGILAAAGLYALDHNRERLAVDHANARRLAEGLAGAGLEPLAKPDTNIVLFRVPDTVGFLRETRTRGCLWNPMAEDVFRAVTHLDVTADEIEEAIRIAREAIGTLKRGAARA
jgi:threonine aldolase